MISKDELESDLRAYQDNLRSLEAKVVGSRALIAYISSKLEEESAPDASEERTEPSVSGGGSE
jgi:hypothetical protein